MGEIGISRHEFYYELRWWEVKAIVRGYNRRHRDMWSATRWQTYHILLASMVDIKKAGITKPSDLIQFPWDDEKLNIGMTDDEIEQMQEEMKQYNKEHGFG